MKAGRRRIRIFDIYARVWEILSPAERKRFMFITLVIFFGGMLELLGLAAIFPLLKVAIDPAVVSNNRYFKLLYESLGFSNTYLFTLFLATCLFFIMLLKNAFMILINYQQTRFTQSVSLRLSTIQFERIFSSNFEFIRSMHSKHLSRDITAIPGKFSVGVLLNLLQFSSEAVVIALIVVGMLLYEPVLFLIVSILLGQSFLIVYKTLKTRMAANGVKQHELQPAIGKTLQEIIHGFIDVTLSSAFRFFGKQYFKEQQELNDTVVLQNVYRQIPQRITEVLGMLGIVLIFLYGFLTSTESNEAFLFLGVFAMATYRITPSINKLLQAYLNIENNAFSMEVLEVADVTSNHPGIFEDHVSMPFKNHIRLDHLGFKYRDAKEFLLKDINLVIKKGETIGFIGQTGGGKSSLLKILSYLFEPTEGKMIIDDTVLSGENVARYHKLLAFVDQAVFLKEGSIMENIAFGVDSDKIDHQHLNKCIESAQLYDFIRDLPQGLETGVGELGNRLSGGQKQRIGIARALYRKAEIFLFDEATSSLDVKTEEQIKSAIRSLSSLNKTVVIVAHRLTTLEDCNRIFEVTSGGLSEPLSFQEMMKKYHNYEVN